MSDPEIPKELVPHVRTAYIPTVEERDGELGATKFGGRPWLAADEEWPLCENCGGRLQLFLQLDLGSIPKPAQEQFGSEGLLQLFYCTNSDPLCEVDCEAYFPYAKSVVARWVPDPSAPSRDDAAGPDEPHAPRLVTGWTPHDDIPNWEEADYALGVELDDETSDQLIESGLPVVGDKLGGWPAWVQGVEYPDCRECGAQMKYVFQIDSNDNVPFMFGDVGAGHLSRCPAHPEVLAFGWACH